MNQAHATASGVSPKKAFKKRSQFVEVWRRLKKDKLAIAALVIMCLLALVAVFARQIAPYGYDDQNMDTMLIPPGVNAAFPLGTDTVGRDILSRLIYGAQISLLVGLAATTYAATFGIILGSLSGYYGGILDNVIMRIVDVMLAIPGILLAIAIAATLGPGINNAMIAVGTAYIPAFARIVRGSILSVREMEYIEAARAVNAGDLRIMVRHVLPNIAAPVIVQYTLDIASAILEVASLSFLGLGVQPPYPEWGAMIAFGRGFLRDYSYLVTMPGIAIMITVFSMNILGDGLRDALDPRLKT
jgi:peptide/nickel transport system permease protein